MNRYISLIRLYLSNSSLWRLVALSAATKRHNSKCGARIAIECIPYYTKFKKNQKLVEKYIVYKKKISEYGKLVLTHPYFIRI